MRYEIRKSDERASSGECCNGRGEGASLVQVTRNSMRIFGIFSVLVSCLSTKSAVVSWDGGGDGGTWHDANNWSADQVPGTTDDVVISIPGTNFTVIIT